ncbi:GNAT family N-acetyltransferase [Thalassovita sp.]|uniref:GNAT family N-acetyltransferase n=1 Tax=Thalassovita sp. TaxID=1979401 RepID=UPI0029DE5652|nr:GNAT family N-acetyltransferase [Thalassovita sp.]
MTRITFDIPTLETDRLILRAPHEEDITQELDFYASDASRYVGGPLRPDEVWRQYCTIMGHWQVRGYGFWGLQDKTSGDYLGRVGLWFPLGWPEPEIGWTLMPAAQGKGFATEAAQAARHHAYDVLHWTTAISLIAPANDPSKAVARRVGAELDYLYDHPKFGQVEIWRHPAPGASAEKGAA